MPNDAILRMGHNVWRTERADRVAFLVDGESYYGAVAHALAQARQSVFLLGWDVHSRIRLLRGHDGDELPGELGRRLSAMLARNPELHVHVLDWDYPVIFRHERETRLRPFTRWPRSRRFFLRYDSFHPTGASHHQKLVVIDDSLVFCGGMDIGLGRWDTTEHRAKDWRRSDPGFPDYVPAHDVVMMADGGVARAIAHLVRQRWQRATGREAVPVSTQRHDRWPASFAPDLTGVTIGISRTQPGHEEQEQVIEVEALHLDAIAAARRWIYIENQYLTSDVVVSALARRLQEPDGPEIVVVLPQNNFGWFESRTIQVLHFECIRRLRDIDVHGRLRVCYPTVPEIGEAQVNLHSKVIVVDDRLLRIGSSNTTNRSMRLDTECDFSIEASGGGDGRVRKGIDRFRNRLLGEHLDMSPDEVTGALERLGSLTALVDSCRDRERCLRDIEPEPVQSILDVGGSLLVDPKEPVTARAVIETFARADARSGHVGAIGMAGITLAAAVAAVRRSLGILRRVRA